VPVLGEAGQIEVWSRSTVEFRWTFRHRIVEDLQLWFVSSKNPRLLLRRDRGHVIAVDDPTGRAGLRADDVIDHVVVLTLRNVSRADMGTYMLDVPAIGLYDLPAVLLISGRVYTLSLLLLLLLSLNGLFSRTTWVSRCQKGKPFWILLEQEMMGWQWHQLDTVVTEVMCLCISYCVGKLARLSANGRMT